LREPAPEQLGKYEAKACTRFSLKFDGKKFVERHGEILPHDGRTLDSVEISISDD
jgi:hypothetical protein